MPLSGAISAVERIAAESLPEHAGQQRHQGENRRRSQCGSPSTTVDAADGGTDACTSPQQA